VAPRSGGFQFFALLAAELYPLRAAHRIERDPQLPGLPVFAATLALGAAWSSR
jgi:hypothetical protein